MIAQLSMRKDQLVLEGARHRPALAILLLMALGLRLVWVVAADVDPNKMGFQYDMTWYHLAGSQIALGNGLTDFDGVATAQWPPGYPLLLGGVYLMTGGSVLGAKLVNVILGTLCCLFTYLIGRRLFGTTVGLLAAALFAAFPGDIFYSALIMSEVFFETVFTGAALLFAVWNTRRGGSRLRHWFVLGAVLGAASLIRGVAAAFLIVPFVIWLVSSRSLRRSLPRVLMAGLGMVCVISPWAIRNYVKLGYPVLISTSLGRTLGHAHSETGGFTAEGMKRREEFRQRFAYLPQPEREVETMKAWRRMTMAYILEHPLEDLRLVPARIYNLYRHGHAGLDWGRERLPGVKGMRPMFDPFRDRAIAVVADAYLFIVICLALLGLPLACSRAEPTKLLLPLTLAYFTFLHSVIFPGDPRYHAALIPFFCISASAALATAGALLHQRMAREGTAGRRGGVQSR